jgi:peptidyl-prolyl cis-trans isomerase SurA
MKFLFVFLLLGSSSATAERALVDGILASVNDNIITRSDLNRASDRFKKNVAVDDLLLLGQSPDALSKDQKKLLDYLIDEAIVDGEIKRLNLAVTLERVEQELRDISKRNGMTRAELNQAIKGQGTSLSEYQDYLKQRLERQNLIVSEITSKIRVTDDDVLAAYIRKYPKQDTGTFEYMLAHIQFNLKKGGLQGAKERADKALGRIKAGESFEALAEQITEDSNFSAGGILGTFKAGEMIPEFNSAVSGLGPGEVSVPVSTKQAVHLLKVISKKVISDPVYEKQKETIRNQLFEETFQKHFRTWLEQKREESFIRINT